MGDKKKARRVLRLFFSKYHQNIMMQTPTQKEKAKLKAIAMLVLPFYQLFFFGALSQ